MKRLLLGVLLFFVGISASTAQSSGGMEYLLDGKISVSAFGGPMVEFSSVADGMLVSSGGGGALLLNQKYFIGGYGLSSRESGSLNSNRPRLGLGHGGFWVGMISQPDRLIHWGVASKLGWGTARSRFNGAIDTENIFVISPEALAEVNVTRWCKINAGVGYRFVTGIREGSDVDAKDFTTPTFSLNFMFGWFD